MRKQMNKKRVTRVTATVLAVSALSVGAFSYFTDYASKEVSATAGTMNMKLTESIDIDGTLNILNPGDVHEFDFKVANTGSKSMDVKHVITLVSSNKLTAADHEYKITLDDGTEVAGELQADGKTIIYTVDDGLVLDGTTEKDATPAATTKDYAYKFKMDENAKNAFQGSTVSVKLELFAKQHRNTTTGWSLIDTYETVAD